MKTLFCCWQDTEQRLFRLAVDALAATQEEVKSAKEAVHFAEGHWRQAVDCKDREQESKWEQKVKEAEQKVKEAEQKVKEAEQKVKEARAEVEKAKPEVKEAKQEVKEQKVEARPALSVALLLCGQIGVRRHKGGSFVWLSFGGPGFLPVLAYPGILSSLPT